MLAMFVKVMPLDYKRVMMERKATVHSRAYQQQGAVRG